MDYSQAIALLKHSDPTLAFLIDQVGECKLYLVQQNGDLLYSLSKAIIYQQISTKAATAIHLRFLKLYPDTVPTAANILKRMFVNEC